MKRESLFFPIFIVGGLAFAASAWFSLESAGQLATDRNPFAIQRSAYGKLMARLAETTVDRVWHMGVEQVAPHSHDHSGDHSHGHAGDHGHGHSGDHACEHGEDCEHGHDCTHSHGDKVAVHETHEHTHLAYGDEPELIHTHPHEHGDAHFHGEDIAFADHGHSHDSVEDPSEPASTTIDEGDVFEYTVTDADRESTDTEGEFELAVSEEDRAAQEEGYHCAMCKETELAQKDVEFTTDSPFIPQAKDFLGHLSALKLVRTNPNGMSEAHVHWAKRKVESQLLRSYKMDPTHYGVYNSYHMFLTVHDFGGTEHTRKQAQVIARHTLAQVMNEKENPEPWLTAASAMMNVYLLKTEKYQAAGEKVPLEILKEYEQKIGFCLQQFDKLQEKAAESGAWDNLTTARQQEITERYLFQTRTFEPFPALIARREAQLSEEGAPEAEVAEILSGDGLEE